MTMSKYYGGAPFGMGKYLIMPWLYLYKGVPLESKKGENMGSKELCFCGSGKRQKSCCMDVDGNSIIAGAHRKFASWEQELQPLDAAKACPANCAACCSQYFYVSKIEYFSIRRFLLKNDVDMTTLIQKADLQMQELKRLHPEEYQKLVSPGEEKNMFSDKDNLQHFLPCVLLNAEGKCAVYPIRPVICRLFGTSKQMPCEKQEHQVESSLSLNMDMIDGIDKIGELHLRPFPLFYWFANDERFQGDYAKAVNCSVNTYYHMLKNGQIPIGKKIYN